MIGCAVQTGVGAVLNTARVEPGATVLVVGAGGVGIAIAQGARIAGAARIIVSDPVAERRDAALAVRRDRRDRPERGRRRSRAVHALTGGIGVDYAFEAVGSGPLIETCLFATRNGGTTVMVGAAPIDHGVTLAPAVLFMISERKLMGSFLGSCHSRRDMPRLLDLWRAGQLDLEGMITQRRPLAEINEAFADLTAAKGIRTVLTV